VFVALWALVGDAGETYDLTNIGTLFAFILVSLGVLVLRYKDPERRRPFRVPLVWPVCVLSAAGCLFIMKGLPDQAWKRFGYWLVIGLHLYFLYGFEHSGCRGARDRGKGPDAPLICLGIIMGSVDSLGIAGSLLAIGGISWVGFGFWSGMLAVWASVIWRGRALAPAART
jgi:hypothetical protein